MSSTRSIISPPPFAANALTVIPPTPVAGVSYRDPAAGPASSPDGWPYAERVNSAEFNQIMFQLSSLLSIMDTRGVLGWSSAADYTATSVTWGSDGALYVWLQASGPNNGGAKDPISNPLYWREFASSRRARFTASGSFTVPAGVTTIYISACASGGGGGSGGSNSGGQSSLVGGGGGGGGGAGQSIMRQPFAVTPGQVIAITLGPAGTGGAGPVLSGAGSTGTAGANAVIGSLITLAGGSPGVGGGAVISNTLSGGGAGGAPGAGDPAGGTGADGNYMGAGGYGASTPFGGGGANGRAAISTTNANAAGTGAGFGSGGGGGGGGYGSAVAQYGGSGGAGSPAIVNIEW